MAEWEYVQLFEEISVCKHDRFVWCYCHAKQQPEIKQPGS